MAQQKKKKQIGVATKESKGIEGEGVTPLFEQEPVTESRREPKADATKPTRRAKTEVKATPAKEAVKKVYENRQDAVAKLLSEAEGNDKVLTVVRKHPAFKHINKEAFDAAVKKKDKIGEGLFRMRIGNMLRGAVTRAKKGGK